MEMFSEWKLRLEKTRKVVESPCLEVGSPCAFSTAAQQRSTGDECGPEDPSEEPKPPLPDCALEHKATKLEEQVRDLTVSRYRKALADSENVRRRTQKFVEDAKLFAENANQQLFCPPILPSLVHCKA
uniref:Uncharacterized protein n=1 Tax=Malurus cyaneus samueli TaxID=2593467 RepID=A0A8C5U2Q7_9PASS